MRLEFKTLSLVDCHSIQLSYGGTKKARVLPLLIQLSSPNQNRITGGALLMTLEKLKSRYQFEKQGLKDIYDDAESFSARVKLFLSIHKRTIAILVATHFVAVMAGMLF